MCVCCFCLFIPITHFKALIHAYLKTPVTEDIATEWEAHQNNKHFEADFSFEKSKRDIMQGHAELTVTQHFDNVTGPLSCG